MVTQPDIKSLEAKGYIREGDTLKSPPQTYMKDYDQDPRFRHTGSYSAHVLYLDKDGRVTREVRQRPMITEESSSGAWRQQRVRQTEIRTYNYDTGQVSIRNPANNITTFRQIAQAEKGRQPKTQRLQADVLKEEQRNIAGKQVTIKTLSQPTYLNVAREVYDRQQLKPKVTTYKTEQLRADQRKIFLDPDASKKINKAFAGAGVGTAGQFLEGLRSGSITPTKTGYSITQPTTYKLDREMVSPYYPSVKTAGSETISFMNMTEFNLPATREYFPNQINLLEQKRNLDFISRSQKAWEEQFFQNIEKNKYAYSYGGPLIYAGGSFFKGLSEFPASVMRTFRNPLKEGLPVETLQFAKAVVTDPIGTGAHLVKKGVENPFRLAGELYGFKKGFEIISPIGPVTIEKAKVPGRIEKVSETPNTITTERGFNKPSADAFSKDIKLGETPETSIIKKIGFDLRIPNPFRKYRSYRLGDKIIPRETPVYIQPFSEGIEGQGPFIPIPSKLAGETIKFDGAIQGSKGPLRVGATPGKLFVEYVNPKYLQYLEDNPLYADLMKLELKVSKPSVEYERVIETTPSGEKIVKTIEKVKPSEAYRELDIDSSGAESSLKTLEPGGGGGGGQDIGIDLGATPFQALQLLSKRRSKTKVVYEEVIIKPFQDFKTGRKTLTAPVTISSFTAVTPSPATDIYIYKQVTGLKPIQINTQINRQAVKPDIKLAQSNINIQTQNLAQGIKSGLNLSQATSTTQTQSLSQAQSQTQTLRQSQSQGQSLRQAQTQLQSLSQAQSLKLSQAQAIKTQNITLTASQFGLATRNPFVQGFDVFLRRRGEFKKVSSGPLSKAEALSLGSFKAEHTAGATFKVLPVPGPALTRFYGKGAPLKRFYKKDGAYIEKSKYRISTAGELSEITFKGISTKKSKKLFKKKGKGRNPFGFKNIFGA